MSVNIATIWISFHYNIFDVIIFATKPYYNKILSILQLYFHHHSVKDLKKF